MIKDLKLTNFRCFEDLTINFSSNVNLITGNNGSGKTSIIEALYLLGRGRSFRTNYLSDLIYKDSDSSVIFMKGANNISDLKIGCEIKRSSLLMKVNSEIIKRRSILLDYLPLQIITPISHQLIDSGPTHRRKFIDWGLFHVEQIYKQTWSDFRRVLKQRNKSLKDGIQDISHWDSEFIKHSIILDNLRTNYFSEIQYFFNYAQEKLLGDKFAEIQYFPGWDKNSDIKKELAISIKKDRFNGWSNIGPHKADLKFVFKESKRNILSRGQQKMLVFSLQIAQCLHLEKIKAITPLLLIDDISSELDLDHTNNILNFVNEIKVQSVISSIDTEKINEKYISNVFHVEHKK